jgi:hypothetical protein
MSKVNENKRHWKILPRYSFIAEEESGDYDKGKPRKGCLNSCGYICHSYLCEDGKFHTITEHIAKYEALMGEVPDNFELDHLDGNKLNNKLSNLAIKTHRDNMLNPNTFEKRIGLFKGDKNPNYGKHTQGKKCLCIELNKIFESAREAAKQMGVSHTGIIAACNGKQKTSAGYHWKYIED